MNNPTFERSRVPAASVPPILVASGIQTQADADPRTPHSWRTAGHTAAWLTPVLAVATIVQAFAGASFIPAAATLAGVPVLFFLARRLQLSRASAAVAALVFVVSPLAVQLTRAAPHASIAVTVLLTAFLLALTPRRQLIGFACAALAFSAAVMLSPAALIALPVLGWVLFRSAEAETRRYSITVAASLLLLTGGGWLIVALVSGSAFAGAPASEQWSAGATLAGWWRLDPVLIVLAPIAAIIGLFVHRLRPFGALFLLLGATVPLGLGVGAALAALPVAALLLAGVTEALVLLARFATRSFAQRIPVILWSAVLCAALIVAIPLWSGQLSALFNPHSSTAADAATTTTSTPAARGQAEKAPTIDAAAEASAARAAASAGHDLALNPGLTAPPRDLNQLASGNVDARVSIILGQILATGNVSIAGFPTVSGDTGGRARQVLITSVSGSSTKGPTAAAASIAAELNSASAPFRPLQITRTSRGLLVTFSNQPFVSAG